MQVDLMKNELAMQSTIHLVFLLLTSSYTLGKFHHIEISPFKNLCAYMVSITTVHLCVKCTILEARKMSGYAKY